MGLLQDPFHLGVVILDKLLKDLKDKIPLLKKRSAEEDEEAQSEESTDEKTNTSTIIDESDEEEDNSLVGKIKKFIAQQAAKVKAGSASKKDADADAESETGEDGEEKKKPVVGQRAKIIRIVVVLGIVALLAQELFSPDDEKATTEAPLQLKPRERPKKKTVEKSPTETPAETTGKTETAVTSPDTTAETTVGGETGGTVTTPVTPETTDTTPETPVTVDTPVTPTTETPVTTTPDTTTPETTVTKTPETETPVEPTPETTTGTTSSGGETTTTSPDITGMADSGATAGTPPDSDMTEQMLKELEKQTQPSTPKTRAPVTDYVSPPDYEFKGRGLVYNCVGKHWACVDAPSYRRCEDNSSSLKFLKKKTECYPFNVYDTLKGCESMQNRVVSSSAKTEFCSEL